MVSETFPQYHERTGGNRWDFASKRKIHELRVEEAGKVSFVYFARIGGNWVDLAPFGNRIPDSLNAA